MPITPWCHAGSKSASAGASPAFSASEARADSCMSASIARRSRLSASSSRDGERALGVVGHEALDAERHVGEPPCGVETRPQHEPQVVGRRAGGIAAGRLKERRDTGLHAARADALQALLHEHAIVCVELDDVRHGAQRDEIEQARERRLALESAAPAQLGTQRQHEIEHDTDAREMLARKPAVGLIRIHDAPRVGQPLCRQMMIGDEHLKARGGWLRRRPRCSRCRCRP